MILSLNKSELVVLKDVFGSKRARQLGISAKMSLTKKELVELRDEIADECNSGHVDGDECNVLNDVEDKISAVLSSKKAA